jgi:hypothetical protein
MVGPLETANSLKAQRSTRVNWRDDPDAYGRWNYSVLGRPELYELL